MLCVHCHNQLLDLNTYFRYFKLILIAIQQSTWGRCIIDLGNAEHLDCTDAKAGSVFQRLLVMPDTVELSEITSEKGPITYDICKFLAYLDPLPPLSAFCMQYRIHAASLTT